MVLGSPATTNTWGDEEAWYYIETKVSQTAFGLTRVQERTVLAVYFGNNGRAGIPMSNRVTTLHSLTVQSNGRILAGGINGTPGTNEGTMLAARFLPDGSPDLSFNGTGWNECDIRPDGPDAAGGVAP